jgi:hypothetical protein
VPAAVRGRSAILRRERRDDRWEELKIA